MIKREYNKFKDGQIRWPEEYNSDEAYKKINNVAFEYKNLSNYKMLSQREQGKQRLDAEFIDEYFSKTADKFHQGNLSNEQYDFLLNSSLMKIAASILTGNAPGLEYKFEE